MSWESGATNKGRLTALLHVARERPLIAGLGLLAFVSLVFLLAPGLDIAVARFFYEPATGFLHERFRAVKTVREAGRFAEMLLAIVVIAPLVLKLILPDRLMLIRPRATLFVVASYVLGVGLVVNFILKEHWGRARPREVLQFGGESVFSPVWWISDQCQGNCSFVSGEGAAAFWLLALAFIVPQRWRVPTIAATLPFAALVSFTRIAMGGHFLSDVLISWLVMLLVLIVLARVLLQGLPPAFDTVVESRLGKAGQLLRRPFALHGPPPPL